MNKKELHDALKKHMPSYNPHKNNKVLDYALMAKNEDKAIKRAKEIRKHHDSNGDDGYRCRSCTNVDELIEALKTFILSL